MKTTFKPSKNNIIKVLKKMPRLNLNVTVFPIEILILFTVILSK